MIVGLDIQQKLNAQNDVFAPMAITLYLSEPICPAFVDYVKFYADKVQSG